MATTRLMTIAALALGAIAACDRGVDRGAVDGEDPPDVRITAPAERPAATTEPAATTTTPPRDPTRDAERERASRERERPPEPEPERAPEPEPEPQPEAPSPRPPEQLGGGAQPGQTALDNLGVAPTPATPGPTPGAPGGGTTIVVVQTPATVEPGPAILPEYGVGYGGAPLFVDPAFPGGGSLVRAERAPGSLIGPRETAGTILQEGVPPVPGTPRNSAAPPWPGVRPGMPSAVYSSNVSQQPYNQRTGIHPLTDTSTTGGQNAPITPAPAPAPAAAPRGRGATR